MKIVVLQACYKFVSKKTLKLGQNQRCPPRKSATKLYKLREKLRKNVVIAGIRERCTASLSDM